MSLDVAMQAAALFGKAIETDEDAETVADIVEAIIDGRGVVWGLPQNAVFAQFRVTPEGHLFAALGPAVGDLKAILAMEGEISAWARSNACAWIEVWHSRPGWIKALKALGYRAHDGVMRKELAGH